ncbi:MAG: glycosyltransferase family 2 protein [Cytophagales bacterium]|nr:glycosyltransferase family 2 protein [Cytophagales bacterium]
MIYFLIPVYNESRNIPELASRLSQLLPNDQKYFVIVNDGSTDDTARLVNEHFQEGTYKLLNNATNSGPGFSFNAGFEYILVLSAGSEDCIVTMEGDNTCDLSILPLMHSLVTEWHYDLALASVYAQGGGFSKTSLLRKIISLGINTFLRFIFDIKVLTLSSFYRVHRVELIRKIKEKHERIIREPGFICAFELLLKSVRLDARIIEVPMILKSDARVGKSKMKMIRTSWQYVSYLLKQLV